MRAGDKTQAAVATDFGSLTRHSRSQARKKEVELYTGYMILTGSEMCTALIHSPEQSQQSLAMQLGAVRDKTAPRFTKGHSER